MCLLHERCVVNEKGERVSVLLDWEEYQRLLEELEELDAIRAYDAARPVAHGNPQVRKEERHV